VAAPPEASPEARLLARERRARLASAIARLDGGAKHEPKIKLRPEAQSAGRFQKLEKSRVLGAASGK
jgi:hypothetical protein